MILYGSVSHKSLKMMVFHEMQESLVVFLKLFWDKLHACPNKDLVKESTEVSYECKISVNFLWLCYGLDFRETT